jgi:hypothetical protein
LSGLGWNDYAASMYEPTIGLFTSTDPRSSERSWVGPYNYLQNNPLNRTDPDGAFYTKAEAREYAKDKNINTGLFNNSKIWEQSDVTFAINDKKLQLHGSLSHFDK